MKRFITLCAVILGFTVLTSMQADQQPEFKFEKETNDFGKIAQGKPVTYEFKFTNIGEQPLILSDVQSSCGCTVPKFTRVPVKKGDSGVITVTFNAAAPGSFNKLLTIKSNAKTPVKYLYIKGEVVTSSTTVSQ
ncbi:DUF1573 domain-containing protein [Pararcticibacter amylolyticus]|uniref:DUF1573 domain-containing protein n=1 Tax=Pararcticibacter amylolyticus TaxID=2173175 RepID=A0A2U2PE37_9SPHI|nr:DUF1573 domain-containing protein [Pararcticibacter amylolyticus]PWG79582.1 DUF1573 domain-containing protein [Pararcticibacter amylolyticus]